MKHDNLQISFTMSLSINFHEKKIACVRQLLNLEQIIPLAHASFKSK